jgi:hypothetical protein
MARRGATARLFAPIVRLFPMFWRGSWRVVPVF